MCSSSSPIDRQRIACPFPMFAICPRSRVLYESLRMTRSLIGGTEESKGSYARGSKFQNIMRSAMSGLSMLNNPGDQKQLGGEFIFESKGAFNSFKFISCSQCWSMRIEEEPGISCLYASRMSTTRNHSEVRDLFAAAGVHITNDEESLVYGN